LPQKFRSFCLSTFSPMTSEAQAPHSWYSSLCRSYPARPLSNQEAPLQALFLANNPLQARPIHIRYSCSAKDCDRPSRIWSLYVKMYRVPKLGTMHGSVPLGWAAYVRGSPIITLLSLHRLPYRISRSRSSGKTTHSPNKLGPRVPPFIRVPIVIHVDHPTGRYRFRDNRRHLSTNANYFYPPVYLSPIEWVTVVN